MGRIYDLIYVDEFLDTFVKEYPEAEITDARDSLHPYRFAILLPEKITEKDYFEFLIKVNAAQASLCFGMQAMRIVK